MQSEWSHSSHIKHESRHIFNKLHSIASDSTFIRRIHDRYPSLILTCNLRAGGWYTDPDITSDVSYFKSTDGHTHQWSFSLKRSNLHLIPRILCAGGALIVDSTRRGKSMPDALSKTIPIWCTVLNKASRRKYGVPSDEGSALVTPEWMIPPTEHDQIEARIDGFVDSLLNSDLQVPKLDKVLKPMFITPQTDLNTLPISFGTGEFTPIVLVSASRFVSDSADLTDGDLKEGGNEGGQGFVYVQGAGDDHENWARGLTPDIFWEHRAELLACRKDNLEALVDRLVAGQRLKGGAGAHWFTPLGLQNCRGEDSADGREYDTEVGETGICIGSRAADHPFTAEEKIRYNLIIHLTNIAPPADKGLPGKLSSLKLIDSTTRQQIYPVHMAPNKKGLSSIRTAFSPAIALAHSTLTAVSFPTTQRQKVLVCCQDGKDLSGSLVVAILASCFTDKRELVYDKANLELHRQQLSKDTMRRRLQWLISANPRAAPSRAFLLRVNELLLSQQHRPLQQT
ncbi:related to RIT1 - initiator tRNA phosphoribosyl-transferase [Melanopsichium pennsylvanicum]|uniref:Related to RIT1 - initiator tRNA phosphoribosyl-transferase n=2 Tax=Melanopsichium pennsylvanicum TaxID=63383 RepID=A0AAJ5C3Y9_9BASI|nr:related to RIT1 - initiator tRNA phosphoribosyl-transferase [Melanopsichium pennsylvanicum]